MMQTENIDTLLNSMKPDVIDIKYKFHNEVKTLQIMSNSEIGEIQEKLLEMSHLQLYEIHDLKLLNIVDNTLIGVAGSPDYSFNNLISNYSYKDIIFVFSPRIKENNRFIHSPYYDVYIRYKTLKEDENIAKQMQEEDFEDESSMFNVETARRRIVEIQNLFINQIDNANIIQLNSFLDMVRLWTMLGVEINNDVITRIHNRIAAISPQSTQLTQQPLNIPFIFMPINQPMNQEDSILHNVNDENDDDEDEDDEDMPPLVNNTGVDNPSQINTTLPINTTLINRLRQIISTRGQQFVFDDVKVINTKEELDELQEVKYSELVNNKELFKPERPCNICLEEYNDDENILILPCKDYYHKDCIGQWLGKNSNKCPLCKTQIFTGKAMTNVIDENDEDTEEDT